MNRDDYHSYWLPAVHNLLPNTHELNNKEKLYALDKLLGIEEGRKYYSRLYFSSDYKMNKKLEQLLINLAGPYGKIILKAYRIKEGLE